MRTKVAQIKLIQMEFMYTEVARAEVTQVGLVQAEVI